MIVVENLCKRWDSLTVLRGVTLRIPNGKTTFILGPNGHGKTVLLKTMVRFLEPDSGRILFADCDICHLTERELFTFWKRIGFVFQESTLLDSLTVEENIALFLKYQTDLDRQQIDARVSGALAEVGLNGIGQKMPAELSGGTKKRVEIARLLVKTPEYILLDEPTSNIDPYNTGLVCELIRRFKSEWHKTTLVVTHDVALARQLADHVVLLKNGEVLHVGDPEQLSDELLTRLYGEEAHEL